MSFLCSESCIVRVKVLMMVSKAAFPILLPHSDLKRVQQSPVWFHLYKVPRVTEFTDTEIGWWVPGSGGGGRSWAVGVNN